MKVRRLGGWGFVGEEKEPPAPLLEFLRAHLGPGEGLPEANPEQHPLPRPLALPRFGVAAQRSGPARVFYSLGQSFPDLWQLRRGQVPAYPDAVLFPSTPVEVQKVLAVASREGIAVISRGGGTSVVGGVSVPADPRPKVVLSLEKLAGLVSLDGRSGLATFLAGTPGPEVEKALFASGFCLGHEPQSWALSTVGGWVATRSAGHRSTALKKLRICWQGWK